MMWIGFCIGVIAAAITYVNIKCIIEWRALRRSNQNLVAKLAKLAENKENKENKENEENEITKNLE